MKTTDKSYETLLRERFKLSAFRLGQKEIIQSILAKKDVLAVLPTGGGKSLCYQFPAVHEKKLVIVISPLIALMKDQVYGLERAGIPAACLHSGQTETEKKEVFRRLREGGAFVLYLSPERAQKEAFHKWIEKREIALFAIDEAHCVSQWGHDFREEYGQLKFLKKIRPDVPALALTASATPVVLKDIEVRLELVTPERHVHGFYRPNLYYQVESCMDEVAKYQMLEQALEQTPKGRVIIYCGTRRSTEEVSERLARSFKKVGFYHAGLSAGDRTKSQEAYGAGEIRILVATNAFGMGVDHPDVRLVVHFQMPANIDSLYQEMGRAGRDGLPSTCLMLYSKKDTGLQSFFIQQSKAPNEIKKARYNTLEALVDYSEGGECRHAGILTYYHDSQRIESCGHCDSCLPDSDRKVQRPSMGEMVAASGEAKTRKRKAAKKEALVAQEGMSGIQKEQFAVLKEWRKQKAKELDVAAFMVFSDRTLREIVAANPRSQDDLREIHGIGDRKLEAFGAEVISKLTELGG
ncbi:MAG: RecQ family ATP-dependent DNA helicase [Bdellovibrionota bacterium]